MLSWEKTETNLSRSRVVLRTRKTVYFAVSMHTFYAFVCMLSSDETWSEQTHLSMFYHVFNHCYSLPGNGNAVTPQRSPAFPVLPAPPPQQQQQQRLPRPPPLSRHV